LNQSDLQHDSNQEILMIKQCLLALVVASAISVAAPFAAAQDNPANNQPMQSAPDNGGRHHGPPDPAQRTAELTKKLNLNSDQQAKVQEALQSERSQMDSLRHDTSLSQQDRHAKMMDIHQATDSQIRGVLDSNQEKKWDEMQARREQRMQNRRSGPPDSGSAPPPQS
jgi:Spy/CpxP family protein refolding chaperone